jgi:integrase
MALTDARIRSAKPADKLYKLSDGGGLQLWITPDGAKRWRLAYRFEGKQRTLAIGVYPKVSLGDAREARQSAKKLLKEGRDPSLEKRLAKQQRAEASANTFDAIADELLDKKKREGRARATLKYSEWLLSLARPLLGARPIREIDAPEVLSVLRVVESRGRHESAHRLRAVIGEVFRFAVATGRASSDPTSALRGALTATKAEHRPAITAPKAFGALLRCIESYDGAPETRIALQLLALTFVRPGELRSAEWSEIDFEAGVWVIPAAKMKMRRPHRVPLAPQAIELLRQLHAFTGLGQHLFPNVRGRRRCMSPATLSSALRRLGYSSDEVTAHGFRSSASSILNESGLWSIDAIERALAHVDNSAIRRAYNRSEYWEERVKMMSWWADRCDDLKRGGEIIVLRA